jgi:hypothetical protein
MHRATDAIGLFLFGGGVLGALGWQIYEWMRSSTWISLTALAPLQWLDVPWALSPKHGLGVHQVLSFARFPLLSSWLDLAAAMFPGYLTWTEQDFLAIPRSADKWVRELLARRVAGIAVRTVAPLQRDVIEGGPLR